MYQDDVLWPDLTVDQNLMQIGMMKGLEEDEVEDRMDLLKNLLALESHSKKKAKYLSGGNKRKLC